MVPWSVSTLSKKEGDLSLTNLSLQDAIMSAKWIVHCLFGDKPWKY
jgi:hypothetical protein